MAKNLVLARAQNAVMAHDWTTAARLYKELLQGNESNVDYLKELGGIYVKAGEDEKAIPYYEQIITFYPHYIDAMNSLGAIYRRLKRYEESIMILQKALEEGRNTATVYYNLGFTYKEMGNYEDAIESFETVITENPDDVLAYNHLGSIYFAQKNYERSIASFKRGLQVDPNHPILNYNLARCYDADKNYAEAVRCYETTLKTRPGWTDAIRDFSELLIKCQDNKKAQTLVEKSIKLHPRDVDLLCILGRIFINQFDYDNATQTYKKANVLDNNNIKVLVGFSEALEKGDNAAEALNKAMEAIEIDPYNKDARKQYAHTLLSNQRYDQAYENIMSLKEETQEKDPQVLDLCAQYYICRGDEAAAKGYHEKIQRVNHHYKEHMLNASDRYVQIGDFDKAEKYAKQFVERRAQLPDGYNRLGAIYQAKGDMKNAKLNYEKGRKILEPNVQADKALKEVNKKIEANPELYEYETPAIEVDAENVQTEEQYIPQSFVGEVVGAETEEVHEDNPEYDFDYSQLGDNVPMGEALVENEDNFWEDFDDDPNVKPKELMNEENLNPEADEEELSEEENLDDDIFTTLGGSEPVNELAEDGDFDFGDLTGNEAFDEEAVPQNTEHSDSQDTTEPETQDMGNPDMQNIDNPDLQYGTTPDSQFATHPNSQPMYQPAYESAYDRKMESVAMNSAGLAMDAAFMAQKMVQQLADQQKNFEEALYEKNERMIHEEVEKAVEEKIQQSMDNQMEKIMTAEEESFGNVEEFVTDEPAESAESTVSEVKEEVSDETVEEYVFLTVDELMGEEATPVENPFAEAEENPEPVEEESFDGVEDFAEDEPAEEELFGEVEDFAEDEAPAEEEPFDGVEDFAEAEAPAEEEPFGGVEDFAEGEAPAEEEPFGGVEDFAEDEAPAEEEPFGGVEDFAEAEVPAEEEPFGGVEDFAEAEPAEDVPVEKETSIPSIPAEFADKIELFKTLRILSNFLPEGDKESFLSCRIRMMIEYIIAKMSGKPGLLITAKALLESGALGEDYDSQLTAEAEEDLSNAMITHVLKYMKKLATSLEDDKLSKALCQSADNILERIELEDQKSQIF